MNRLLDNSTRDRIRAFALASLYLPNRAKSVVAGHDDLYDFASAHIGSNSDLIYLEFGVAAGKSMAAMARRFTSSASRFYGFDSFLGLPEPWLHFSEGTFSMQGHAPSTQDNRVSFVKGWFQNTFPPFFANFEFPADMPVLIHFDADLYSSTLFLLASLWPLCSRYHFIMDDFIYDDVVALSDFANSFPVDLEFHAQTRGGGQGPNPDQVFGTMQRKAFALPNAQ